MSTIDWTTISTIASTVALVMGGFLWLASKVFRLGQTAQRLDSIESDIASIRADIRSDKLELSSEINTVRHELGQRFDMVNQRMDKLILTISESNTR
ncbi:MAG TPA: hypothetical protein VI322_02550 [Candidatus Saccharimonadia bacterium]